MYRFVKLNGPFDIRVNFWETNYQLRFIDPFSKIYDLDDGGNKSSQIMWCIWLYCDPNTENRIYRRPEEQKKSSIQAYYPDFDFKDTLINEAILSYPEACMTNAAQDFDSEVKGLRKFTKMIQDKMATEELTLDHYITVRNNRGTEQEKLVKGTAKQFAELKEKCVKLFQNYEKIKSIFFEEQAEQRLFGGGEETLMDEGGLMEISDAEY